jgi:hypothetical protein
MRVTYARGFVSEAQAGALLVDDDAMRLLARLRDAAKRATAADDYSKI